MKLYISDLDGTLLNSKEMLSNETISILKELMKNNLNFTIATGRSLYGARKYIDELGIKLPVVLSNGAYIYDPVSKEYISKNYLDFNIVTEFLKLCEERNLQTFVYALDEGEEEKIYHKNLIHEPMKNIYYRRLQSGDKRQKEIKTYEELSKANIITISLIDKEAVLRPLFEYINHNFSVTSYLMEDHQYPGYFWLEIYNIKTSKGKCVEYLKEYLSANEIVSFGDGNNDISMFEISDKSFAVSNASDFVKSKASGLIGTNDENSVAKYILKNYNL